MMTISEPVRMEGEVLQIDGSLMEGGGQILRMSVGLAALLRRPIQINNIRAGRWRTGPSLPTSSSRSSPGLKAQHLTGIHLVKDLTQGRLQGGSFGSTEIAFRPG